jgi:hypothetical protein
MIGTGAVLAFGMLADGGLRVDHEPLRCARADYHARVVAAAEPAEEVASAELLFRTDQGGWYRISMGRTIGGWTALLPRTTSGRDAFEYQLLFTSTRAGEPVISPVVRVPVTATCAADSKSAVATTIVVTVPAGAPVVPPVPPGFSPTGVASARESENGHGSSRKPIAVLAAAGAVAALAVAGTSKATSDPPDEGPDIPFFLFNDAAPRPGTPVSLAAGGLTINVLMSHIPEQPIDLIWRAEFRQAANGPACVVMQDVFKGAQMRVALLLTAPLSSSGACGPTPVDTTVLRLTIDVGGEPVHDSTTGFPFRFEP